MISRVAAHWPVMLMVAMMVALSAGGVGAAAPPPTPSNPVVDTYFGVQVSDPYRWMEDHKSTEFQTWLQQQNAFTEQTLSQLDGRARLRERLLELAQQSPNVRELAPNGDLLFYLAS